MFRFAKIFGLLSAILFAAACGSASDPTPDYRYRLTVEVDTPEGLRTGSSVIEVSTDVAGEYSIPTPGAVRTRARGEAVTVDLGERGVLFALLRSEGQVDWAGNLMFRLAPAKSDYQASFNAMRRMRHEKRVPRYFHRQESAYPMLVTFADLDDPTSVALVDPDDLAATFGEGVMLERITVQMTNDPVTTGIEERLGWLSKYPEPRLDPDYRGSTDPTLSQRLWHGDFRKGVAK